MTAHRKRMMVIYNRRYRQKRLIRLRAQGLTLAGTPRKNHWHNLPRVTPSSSASNEQTRLENMRVRYRFHRDRKYDRCLTARGTPRKVFRLLTQEELRSNELARKRARRQNFIARGLTTNGTVRKRGLLSPTEAEYRAFRASLNLPQSREWSDYGTSSAARIDAIAEAA